MMISALRRITNQNIFRILVLAVTNTAVDNIAERIIELQTKGSQESLDSAQDPFKIEIQRLGTGCLNEVVQEESIKEKFNDKAFVTFTTSASSSKLEGNHFNLLIIDEAS